MKQTHSVPVHVFNNLHCIQVTTVWFTQATQAHIGAQDSVEMPKKYFGHCACGYVSQSLYGLLC